MSSFMTPIGTPLGTPIGTPLGTPLGTPTMTSKYIFDKFKIERTSVPKAIKIVENGILYNFQLQKQDYKNLSL